MKMITKKSTLRSLGEIVSGAFLALMMGCSRPVFEAAPAIIDVPSPDYSGITLVEKPRKKPSLLNYATNLIAADMVRLAAHESGHATAGTLSGLRVDEIYHLPSFLTGIHPHVSYCGGVQDHVTFTFYDEEGRVIGDFGRAAEIQINIFYKGGKCRQIRAENLDQINDILDEDEREREQAGLNSLIGGPLATMGLAESTSYMLRNGNVSEDTQAFWSTVALVSRADFLGSTFNRYSESGGRSDFNKISERTGVPQGYFAAAGVLYTALNHNRIAKEFRVAAGLETFDTDSPVSTVIFPIDRGVQIAMSLRY